MLRRAQQLFRRSSVSEPTIPQTLEVRIFNASAASIVFPGGATFCAPLNGKGDPDPERGIPLRMKCSIPKCFDPEEQFARQIFLRGTAWFYYRKCGNDPAVPTLVTIKPLNQTS